MPTKEGDFVFGERKWETNGEDAQLLQQLIRTNVINIEKWSAYEICKHYPQFRQYPLNNFRSVLYRYKSKNKENKLKINKSMNDNNNKSNNNNNKSKELFNGTYLY